MRDEIEDLTSVDDKSLIEYLKYANAYGAYTTTKEGALAAMATREEMENWMQMLEQIG